MEAAVRDSQQCSYQLAGAVGSSQCSATEVAVHAKLKAAPQCGGYTLSTPPYANSQRGDYKSVAQTEKDAPEAEAAVELQVPTVYYLLPTTYPLTTYYVSLTTYV